MKLFFFVIFIYCVPVLFAAPLRSGFPNAPGASASAEEREVAFLYARNSVIESAFTFKGTPYRFGGTTRSGLDCSGFIYISFREAVNVSLPRTSLGMYSWSERIPLEQAQPGDLLFFRTDHTGRISHVALYLGNRRFIHSASAGPSTGVILSTLDERFWARTFASAGRAFPGVHTGFSPVMAGLTTPAGGSSYPRSSAPADSGWGGPRPPAVVPTTAEGRLLLSVGLAPTWVGFLRGGDLFRGVASKFRVAAETHTFGRKMVFGLEVRPEYDGVLGVFRMPMTFSWGPNEQFSIFAGPVLSFGDAAISTEDGMRSYTGGTSWLGAIGITAAPFNFEVGGGALAPYLEAAWQRYISDNDNRDFNADFSAGFRFSTGVRWTFQARR